MRFGVRKTEPRIESSVQKMVGMNFEMLGKVNRQKSAGISIAR